MSSINDSTLHVLWTKAVGTDGYDKSQWKALEREFHRLAAQVNAMAEIVAASTVLRDKHKDVFVSSKPDSDTGRWRDAIDHFHGRETEDVAVLRAVVSKMDAAIDSDQPMPAVFASMEDLDDVDF